MCTNRNKCDGNSVLTEQAIKKFRLRGGEWSWGGQTAVRRIFLIENEAESYQRSHFKNFLFKVVGRTTTSRSVIEGQFCTGRTKPRSEHRFKMRRFWRCRRSIQIQRRRPRACQISIQNVEFRFCGVLCALLARPIFSP